MWNYALYLDINFIVNPQWVSNMILVYLIRVLNYFFYLKRKERNSYKPKKTKTRSGLLSFLVKGKYR